MSFEQAMQVADAVLFEGYILYPYRASAPKNQVRWQFGVLAPPGADPSETSIAQTECLVDPRDAAPALQVYARFLQVQARSGELPWEEGVVRETDAVMELIPGVTTYFPFEIPGGQDGPRRRWPLTGVLSTMVERLPGPYGTIKVRIRLENRTQGPAAPRVEMLRRSLVAAHTLLGVRGGVFLSLTDPPEWASAAAADCANLHTWPVLIDDTTMLSSPIILYDHPKIAPESTANLHDSIEIDELLLRTMTLTDEEKREARATDDRAAAIIDHAVTIPPEVFERLHRAVRNLRHVPQPAQPAPHAQAQTPWWDPGADRTVSPATDAVEVPGGRAARGAKVRLNPGRRADAHDMFIRGRTATVAAVLFDVDGQTHLAVTLDDDPAAALHESVGRYLYFAPDEVEML